MEFLATVASYLLVIHIAEFTCINEIAVIMVLYNFQGLRTCFTGL